MESKGNYRSESTETESLVSFTNMTTVLDITFNTMSSCLVYNETEKSQRALSIL